MIKTPERTDASHRLGVEAEHGDLYDLREEIEVGDGEDVRLDGGVGGHHETAAHDSDMQVLAAMEASHSSSYTRVCWLACFCYVLRVLARRAVG